MGQKQKNTQLQRRVNCPEWNTITRQMNSTIEEKWFRTQRVYKENQNEISKSSKWDTKDHGAAQQLYKDARWHQTDTKQPQTSENEQRAKQMIKDRMAEKYNVATLRCRKKQVLFEQW